MTYADFTATLTAPTPPPTLPPVLRALWLEHHGHWEAAHDLAQDHATDPLTSWLHAYLHRREGDAFNAGYWYRRAGRSRFAGTEAEEWQALVETALAQTDEQMGR